jgi:hypothetical protein
VKPPLSSRRNTSRDRHLAFGNRPGVAMQLGDAGLNSRISIDTANEVEAGRGKTITDLHCSEAAFWRDPKKALSLLNAVPDEPETFIVLESTANGSNWFKARCDRAARGEGAFKLVFIGWTEDPDCTKNFPSAEQREAFIATIGKGPYGADEPRLIERFGCTPEQLYWRRTRSSTSAKASSSCSSRSTRARRRRRSSGRASTSSRSSSSAVRWTARRRSSRCRRSAVGLAGPQQGLLLPPG